ncbi:hypothetical protein N7532_009989 [Penicillium argentinense]|uniref:CENP-V/GFA domain-containing protein n=1 Tax=Penicillium argentinense TaxID=1131581 RepID=A0A9W9ENQ7_9EURO|nr:uncharacterized protein N7532_009989 [Penicillium argentinense]KAJ5085218.1 hypothetical protein N7532_009989 [Penicillium argentinense]
MLRSISQPIAINTTSNVKFSPGFCRPGEVAETGMRGEDFEISQLAIPLVTVLISFLAYTSQYFFHNFEAAPLTLDEGWAINLFALCIWVTYFRACFVDPGRLDPKGKPVAPARQEEDQSTGRKRWCRRCEAYKPPRAHHCKTCKRYDAAQADTKNHFAHIFSIKMHPENGSSLSVDLQLRYLGPSVGQLIHLFVLIVVNTVTWLGIFILLVRTLYSVLFNITTIESWEIERHDTLVRRARVLGGSLEGPGGVQVRIRKQEFPYDIGLFPNIAQAMGGTINIFSWFWPFAATPDRKTGWEFETNGFEDAATTWPPPDPDRIPMPTGGLSVNEPDIPLSYASARDQVKAFEMRQAADMDRRRPYSQVQRRKRFHERLQDEPLYESDEERERQPGPVYGDGPDEGEESWRNAEGERLRDFGVDEDVEFYDEDDLPLGLLIERKRRHVRITLPQQPENSIVCHCDNCKKVGGAFSINYFIPEDNMTIEDPSKTLKIYEDPNTATGNRNFCSNCGSAIFTKTPKAPGKVFLKATLFPTVAPKGGEVFAESKLQL